MSEDRLLVTCCNMRYEENMVHDMLPSVRKEGNYDGPIVLLDYGITKQYIEELALFRVDVVPKKHYPHFQNTVDVLRPFHFVEMLDKYPDTKHFVYMDAGDVWVQDDISHLFEIDGFGLAAESAHYTHPWGQNVLHHIGSPPLREEMISILEQTVIRNFGIFGGDTETIKKVCEIHVDFISQVGRTHFGIDQAFANFMWHKQLVKPYDLPITYNYVTQAHPWKIEGDKVYDLSGNLIKVIHNAGAKVTPRIYKYEKEEPVVEISPEHKPIIEEVTIPKNKRKERRKSR